MRLRVTGYGLVFLVIANETAYDDDNGSGDEDVVTPGFDVSYAKRSTYGQDDEAYD